MPIHARTTPAASAAAGEHEALGEHLADEPPAAAAERRAHRQLPLARGRAHEQQVRDVGARDQQHERHRPHQREDRGPHVGDEVLVHRLDAQVHACRLLDRELLAQIGGERVELPLRLGTRDAGLQAPDDAQKDVDARAGGEIDAQRRPQIGRALDVRCRAETAARTPGSSTPITSNG